MDDEGINAIRSQLDRDLANADTRVGILFGWELFNAFREREWFTIEAFSWGGTGAFPLRVVAYDRSHCATPIWDGSEGLGEWDYKVGSGEF